MFWLIAIVLLVLVIAPLRNAFFAAWRFTIPAAAGLIAGVALAAFLVRFGLPGWTMLFMPCVFAMGIGSAGKQWLDENFGPPKGPN
jgi:hypothetical protein